MSGSANLDVPGTEAVGGLRDLDLRSTRELAELMNEANASVPVAVAEALDEIAAAVDAVVERLRRGGRLVLSGAGTSGRLAAAEAAECGATFSTPPDQIVALVAGASLPEGPQKDAAEDEVDGARRDSEALRFSTADAVVVVSASGRTPYALGVGRAARTSGALTIALVSNPDSELERLADRAIVVPVGPEIVAGSTRLKAGTAQKLVLNMLTTISMIRLGKTFGDLMVDVRATSGKLRDRVRRIVMTAADVSEAEADAALAAAGGDAKIALVSLLAEVDAATAVERLRAAGGNVRAALS